MKKYSSSKSKLYMVYMGNKNRCENPNNTQYHLGGGMGIKFTFKDYEHFRKWSIRTGYIPGESMLRRKNLKGDFNAHNCYWGNRRGMKIFNVDDVEYTTEELANKLGVCKVTVLGRSKKYGEISDKFLSRKYEMVRIKVNYKGEEYILKELLESRNINMVTYSWRVNNGWSIESAIDTPISKRKMPKKYKRHILKYKGEEMTIEEISDMIGIKEGTIRGRLYSGVSVEDVIETPLNYRHSKNKN